jgi:hypothetical protein
MMYFVTVNKGSSAFREDSDLLFASATEPHAWMLYSSMRPSSGTTIALWRPDQSLVASKAGPRVRQ